MSAYGKDLVAGLLRLSDDDFHLVHEALNFYGSASFAGVVSALATVRQVKKDEEAGE